MPNKRRDSHNGSAVKFHPMQTSTPPIFSRTIDAMPAIDGRSLQCIAVIIPCYRVREHILNVIGRVGPEVKTIYAVDDACPEQSGDFLKQQCTDPRVRIVFNQNNLGVGGAVMAGYRAAVQDGHDILVKIDGDGQMPPELLPYFVEPILTGRADYTKGNRFYDLNNIGQMPRVRLIGNALLSFLNKFSSGYWNIFDPTNGYTAIQARVASHLPFDKISARYFFESDMLFRLNTLQCRVIDIPMDAQYGNEKSSLKIRAILAEFLWKHTRNFSKRIFYNYFLRDMSLASLELVFGAALLIFGLVFGGYHWLEAAERSLPNTPGTVMLSATTILMGMQLLLSFIGYDIQSVPKDAVYGTLKARRPIA